MIFYMIGVFLVMVLVMISVSNGFLDITDTPMKITATVCCFMSWIFIAVLIGYYFTCYKK